VKLVTSRTRQVPRTAPRILLSSKESILDQAPGRNVDLGRGETAEDERQESGFRTAPEPRSDIGLPVLWQPVYMRRLSPLPHHCRPVINRGPDLTPMPAPRTLVLIPR